MDAENLKLITDTLKTLGEAGLTGFISWLLLEKLVPVVAWISSMVIAIKMLIIPIASMIRDGRAANVTAEYMKALRDILQGRQGGFLTFTEAHQTFEKLAKLAVDDLKKTKED